MKKKLLGAGMGLLVGALSAVGCGDSEANLYTQYTNAQDSAVALVCECFEALEAPSEAACIAELGDEVTAAEQACLEDVYATYRTESLTAVRCQMSVFDDAVDCVNAVAACDPDAIQACFDAADTAGDACPELPQVVSDAEEACFN